MTSLPTWIQQYIESLPKNEKLTEEELNKNHPYRKTIHRKVYSSMKKYLGHIKTSPNEFTKTIITKTWAINMDTPNMGLSCSGTCDYLKGSFIYPYELLAHHIPESLISRDEDNVLICGEYCLIFGCYNRDVMSLQTKTVGEALECYGKDDSFLIDDNFSCYWKTKDYCILCLRKSIDFDTSNMKTQPKDQSIMLSSLIFDTDPWTKCTNSIGVKLPTIIFDLVERNEMLQDVLDKMPEEKRTIIQILMTAFKSASIDDIEENIIINDAITSVFYASSFNELNVEIIIQIIDKYECAVYGYDSSEWNEKLRPLLKSI